MSPLSLSQLLRNLQHRTAHHVIRGLWYHRKFPMVEVDICLSTHDHFDHNALERVNAPMKLDRMAGLFVLGDVSIEGIAEKHTTRGATGVIFDELGIEKSPPNNVAILDNTMYIVTTGGLRFLFWGDNRPNPPADILKRIGNHFFPVLVVFGCSCCWRVMMCTDQP